MSVRVTRQLRARFLQHAAFYVVGIVGIGGIGAACARTVLAPRTRPLHHCIRARVVVARGLHIAAVAFIRILARGICAIPGVRVRFGDVRCTAGQALDRVVTCWPHFATCVSVNIVPTLGVSTRRGGRVGSLLVVQFRARQCRAHSLLVTAVDDIDVVDASLASTQFIAGLGLVRTTCHKEAVERIAVLPVIAASVFVLPGT
jgi:hypothetical protein